MVNVIRIAMCIGDKIIIIINIIIIILLLLICLFIIIIVINRLIQGLLPVKRRINVSSCIENHLTVIVLHYV